MSWAFILGTRTSPTKFPGSPPWKRVCPGHADSSWVTCEQALLFGQAKRASRERASEGLLSSAPRGFAARSRVLARLVSLAQIGELARRLRLRRLDYVENKEHEVSWELCKRFSALWSSLYLHMNQTFLRFSMYKKGYNV